MPRRTETAKKYALYRHYAEDGTLLYVGMSLSVVSRLIQHKYGSPWYTQVVRIEIEWFTTKRKVMAAEKRAIRKENPVHNIRDKYGARKYSTGEELRTVQADGRSAAGDSGRTIRRV